MIYACIVALLSLAGAAAPLRVVPGHARLQIYLSAAAGALLGAAFFHLLPESVHYIGENFGWPAAAGIIFIFLLQRYIAPHSHEAPHAHGGEAIPDLAAGRPPHTHAHPEEHCDGEHLQATGPFLGSLVAILALSIHSFLDGVAIGAAVGADDGTLVLSVFLSVLIHKPMDGLSVSVLLINAGTKRRTLWLVQIIYAALVPLGAAAFMLTRGSISDSMAHPLLGYTLAFSAGTFCSIALTDLLPELHFHSHDRNKLTAAMLLSMGAMLAAQLIGHPPHD